jgi:hypothetical protein
VTTVTLLEKAYGSFSTRSFENTLRELCRDLKIKTETLGSSPRGWIKINVSGDDEAIALRLLDREIGLAPASTQGADGTSSFRGKVVNATKSRTELYVDVGLSESGTHDASIPLWRLQAQLGDGRKMPLQRFNELFCFFDFSPLSIRFVNDLRSQKEVYEAEISETQLSKFSDWLKSNLDRLIVLGASRREVVNAVERAHHFRDVSQIETLGPLEHALLCKLGTDAVGLVPKLGPYLTVANLAPFSPRKIKQLIGRRSL